MRHGGHSWIKCLWRNNCHSKNNLLHKRAAPAPGVALTPRNAFTTNQPPLQAYRAQGTAFKNYRLFKSMARSSEGTRILDYI